MVDTQSLSLSKLLQSFFSDGWVVLVLSLAGALTRLTLFEDNTTIIDFIRRITSAVALGMLAWFILSETNWPQLYKVIIYIVIGLDSPSVIKGILKTINIFTSNPTKFINSIKDGRLPEVETQPAPIPQPEEVHKPHRRKTYKHHSNP